MKITIIGGGAYSWTPELVRDFAVSHGVMDGGTICLMDINPEALELVAPLCRKIIAAAGADIKIETSLDREQSLAGADIVLVSINTGGCAAYGQDVDIPLKYGMRARVGDTSGPTGIARSLRNVPVADDIARSVHKVCPRAWVINVTNPMGTFTRVMRMRHERTVGYCHEVEWLRLRVAYRFKVPRESVQAVTAGVNHMSWVLSLRIGDRADGLEMLARDVAEHGPLNDQGKPTPIVQEIYELYGALPVSHDPHISEFYAPWARPEIADRYGLRQCSGEVREVEVQQKNIDKCKDLLSGRIPLEMNHSFERISLMVPALMGQGIFQGVANLPNVGQVDNLPRGCVLETNALYDLDRVTPLATGPLRTALVSTLIQHCLCQELTVEGCLNGDRRKIIEAMLTQPQIFDFASVPRMVDEMLQAQRQWLPQFFR